MKKYILLPITLFFIVMGAAMPYLTFQMQDAKLNGYQKEVQLSHNSLAGRNYDDIEPVLRLISNPHNEDYWEGKTALRRSEVYNAVKDTLKYLCRYDILPEEILENTDETEWSLEPCVLWDIDSDESALVWMCTWAFDGNFMAIDDATGKAVRIIAGSSSTDENSEDNDIYYKLNQWVDFLRDYYDMEILSSEENELDDSGNDTNQFTLRFSSKGSSYFDLCIDISDNFTFFNY